MKHLAVLTCCGLLVGCQALNRNWVNYARTHSVPAGSQIVLDKPLTMPPRQRDLFIQYGQVLRQSQLNQYDAYCRLVVKSFSGSPRTIVPDVFTVTHFNQELDFTQTARLRAPRFIAVAHDGETDGDLGPVPHLSVMQLHSAKQPDVDQLICGQYVELNEGDYLTVAEMQATLKGLFTLKPAPISATR